MIRTIGRCLCYPSMMVVFPFSANDVEIVNDVLEYGIIKKWECGGELDLVLSFTQGSQHNVVAVVNARTVLSLRGPVDAVSGHVDVEYRRKGAVDAHAAEIPRERPSINCAV